MTQVMDGYVRVSQVGGRAGDRFQSPDQQRDAIQAWAKANGVRIAQIHEDLDRSGGTMDRPGMNLVRQRIAAGVTAGVVVSRLDRFSRTLIGGLTTIQELNDAGARVVSVAENIDPSNPMGRAMLGLILLMAAWQRDQADEYLGLAQARAASAGRFPGRPAHGYMRDEHGHTIVDEPAAEAVRMIFRKRATGQGWRTIARDMTDSPHPTPSGRNEWAETSVIAIVRSEAPIGVFVGPRGLRVEEAWPPLVDRQTWEQANHRGTQTKGTLYEDRLVAGIARCANCRRVLHRHPNAHGFVSYMCPNKSCRSRVSIGAEILDEHIRGLVNPRMAKILVGGRHADGDREGERLTAARDAAALELVKWRDDVGLREALGEQDWREGILARANDRDETEVALAQHRASLGLASLVSPGGGAVRLEELPWDWQRLFVGRLLHSVWVRRSPVTGTMARQLVAERVWLVWADDRIQPAFPGAAEEAETPVRWGAPA